MVTFSQETTNGDRKIIDLIDTTGSGDVDTSTIRTTFESSNREIQSLTGRLLRIPDEWNNPSGKWHIGCKIEYELLPSSVKNRIEVYI